MSTNGGGYGQGPEKTRISASVGINVLISHEDAANRIFHAELMRYEWTGKMTAIDSPAI
jgi:hypothetical protein